jgi:hypothetical protein
LGFRQDKCGFREIHFLRNALHIDVGKCISTSKNSQLVAGIFFFGKYINDVKSQPSHFTFHLQISATDSTLSGDQTNELERRAVCNAPERLVKRI